jgi:uncharacterized protein
MSLQQAIRAGDYTTAVDLIRKGADIHLRGADGFTALMTAAGLGLPDLVEQLLGAGVDVHAVEPQMGAGALHLAAQSGNPDVIRLLIDHGAFIDQQSPILGNTALIDAVLYRSEDAVQMLLTRGARTEIRNHWQQTALELAEAEGLEKIADLIKDRKASDAERIRSNSLIAAVKAGDISQIKRLISEGADIEEQAPATGSVDDFYTSLAIACREGNAGIVRLLLAAGADPRRPIGLMQGTALHEASYFGHSHVVRELVRGDRAAGMPGPDLSAQGPYNGLTALHDAVWHGHVETAQVLIASGSPLVIKTHTGHTPKELAVRYGYDELARRLGEAERAQP